MAVRGPKGHTVRFVRRSLLQDPHSSCSATPWIWGLVKYDPMEFGLAVGFKREFCCFVRSHRSEVYRIDDAKGLGM